MFLHAYVSAAVSFIALMAAQARAAMQPSDIQSTCNALATSAFGLKNLVLVINSTSNAGPMQVRPLPLYTCSLRPLVFVSLHIGFLL